MQITHCIVCTTVHTALLGLISIFLLTLLVLQHNDDQIECYLTEVQESSITDSIAFWRERKSTYCRLFLLAMDVLAAPASQAYVERMFSLTGYLSAGRRNRMEKSLELRAFLKMNKPFAQL